MSFTRRSAIKSGAAVLALAAAASKAAAAAPPALIVFDSRIPASCAFAQRHIGPRIDVAKEDASFWRQLRADTPTGSVVGMTGWSDWVVVRGLLEEKGKRLKSETASGKLFHWTMV
jgi:hypothetical protein